MGTTGTSFTNDRMVYTTYDASGNILVNSNSHAFDAAGNQTDVSGSDSVTYDITEAYDGDGQVVYRDQEETDPTAVSMVRYYLRSSVLGDNVVAEMDNASS